MDGRAQSGQLTGPKRSKRTASYLRPAGKRIGADFFRHSLAYHPERKYLAMR